MPDGAMNTCGGCGVSLPGREEVCITCANLLELEDRCDRQRVLLEAIEEIAVGPVNDFETPLNRLDMILRLARKGAAD
jgi:hypothetical protein